MKNPTVKKSIKVVTIAGSAVLVVGAAMTLISAKNVKEAVMPLVSILVGVAAFNYAMNDKVEVVNK
jgi:NADH:ubiquinone oxidoreductase subunit 6 (subunit J)